MLFQSSRRRSSPVPCCNSTQTSAFGTAAWICRQICTRMSAALRPSSVSNCSHRHPPRPSRDLCQTYAVLKKISLGDVGEINGPPRTATFNVLVPGETLNEKLSFLHA